MSPGISVWGTISITSSEVYFEVDEDNEEFKKIDPKVGIIFLLWFFVLCDVCMIAGASLAGVTLRGLNIAQYEIEYRGAR